MSNRAVEITKKTFYSSAYNRYAHDDIPLEDCQFLNFTEFLDEIDIYKNPTASRVKGFYKGNYSLLGYSLDVSKEEAEDEIEDTEDENLDGNLKFSYHYTIFNGIFSDTPEVSRLLKSDIDRKISETVRFLEKTFSEQWINDINEARDLQNQLIKTYKEDSLNDLEICIISDNLIDTSRLPNKITIKSIDRDCRIRYWDIRRWNDVKRSKSKRESINIDLNSDDFRNYIIPYINQKSKQNITYYLSIFPGDLIADLYDIHKTGLLENNVRVFLSATKKANKAIVETIGADDGQDAYKFFSYNNGITATAEKVEIENNKIVKITDFQIVNGGQTTATVHYSSRKKGFSLKDVFIAVKITELPKDKNYSKIVSNISQAANTQSAVSESDFFANDKMLIQIERLSLRNPIQTDDDRSIYYFFERMKGQYNVGKLSQPTNVRQRMWMEDRPKSLKFDKIDIARWSNIMHELPHIAATGAQKQFKDFMNDKYYKRVEIDFNNYRTLVGLGLLFKRIKKLCGTANGVAYPSLTIDPVTGTHAPVAMSTALYTTSFIHLFTSGCLDYWGFYDYKYSLAKSVNSDSRNRIDSELDSTLEAIIKLCWNQIAKFGGAAAQEKSKTKECWEYVKSNLRISDPLKKELQNYMVTLEEKKRRDSVIDGDYNYNYFKAIDELFQNRGVFLPQLLNFANTNSGFFHDRQTLRRFIQKIKKNSLLTVNRVREIFSFYNKIKGQGFEFEIDSKENLVDELFPLEIYEKIFKDSDEFLDALYEKCFNGEEFLEEKEKEHNRVKEIIENYYLLDGLTIEDLYYLNNFI